MVIETMPYCPFCSASISTRSGVMTIEKTCKRWKGLRLIAILMFVVYFLAIFGFPPGRLPYYVIVLPISAVVILIYSWIGAWWTNG